MANRRGKVKSVTALYLGGCRITADGDRSHEIRRCRVGHDSAAEQQQQRWCLRLRESQECVPPVFSEAVCLRLIFLKYLMEFTSEIPWTWSFCVGKLLIQILFTWYRFIQIFLFLLGLSLMICVFLGVCPFHLRCLIWCLMVVYYLLLVLWSQ